MLEWEDLPRLARELRSFAEDLKAAHRSLAGTVVVVSGLHKLGSGRKADSGAGSALHVVEVVAVHTRHIGLGEVVVEGEHHDTPGEVVVLRNVPAAAAVDHNRRIDPAVVEAAGHIRIVQEGGHRGVGGRSQSTDYKT